MLLLMLFYSCNAILVQFCCTSIVLLYFFCATILFFSLYLPINFKTALLDINDLPFTFTLFIKKSLFYHYHLYHYRHHSYLLLSTLLLIGGEIL